MDFGHGTSWAILIIGTALLLLIAFGFISHYAAKTALGIEKIIIVVVVLGTAAFFGVTWSISQSKDQTTYIGKSFSVMRECYADKLSSDLPMTDSRIEHLVNCQKFMNSLPANRKLVAYIRGWPLDLSKATDAQLKQIAWVYYNDTDAYKYSWEGKNASSKIYTYWKARLEQGKPLAQWQKENMRYLALSMYGDRAISKEECNHVRQMLGIKPL